MLLQQGLLAFFPGLLESVCVQPLLLLLLLPLLDRSDSLVVVSGCAIAAAACLLALFIGLSLLHMHACWYRHVCLSNVGQPILRAVLWVVCCRG